MKCKGKGRKGKLPLNDGETALNSMPMVSLGLPMLEADDWNKAKWFYEE